jgi:hypothetical protein
VTYVSPYAPADSSSTTPAKKTTYVSPYAPAVAPTPLPDTHKVRSPEAGVTLHPAVNTSANDAAISAQDAAITKPVSGAFSALQRVPDAWDATLTGGNPGSVLTGSASDEDKAATAAKIDAALKRFPGGDNPTIRGAYHLGMNPLNLLDLPLGAAAKGRSAAQLATDALEGHGFAAAVKGSDKLAGLIQKAPGGKNVTDAVAKAHDLLGVHSAAKRELARLSGAKWLDRYADYRAQLMRFGGQSPEESLEADLRKHLMEVPPDQRAAYERALTRGGEGLPFASQISPKGKTAPPPSVETGDPSQIGFGLDAPKPSAAPPRVVAAPRPKPKTIPEVMDVPPHGPATINTNAFAIPASKPGRFAPQVGFGPKPKPKMTPAQAKAFYADAAAKKAAATQPKFVTNPNRPDNSTLGLGETGEQGSLFSKPPETVAPTTKKPLLGETGPLQTLRAHSATADVAKRLGGLSDEDRKIFGLMKDQYTPTGAKGSILDYASLPSDLITGGMFVQPLGHMANISGLGAMTDPLAVAKALGTGTKDNANKLLGAITRGKVGGGETEEAIAARHAGAQRGGAISTHKTERENPLDSGLSGASSVASKVPVVGKALSLVPKAVQGLYRASGDVLWKFDDEVKANRFQNLVDGGMEPNRAGLRVGGELVDYENKSPAARALRPIAPFSTWRTKAPLAVARNAVENPGKTSALSNIFPAAMGGSQGQDADSGKPYISSLPGAEFNGATSGLKGAGKYALGTEGTVPKIGMDTVGWLESLGLPNTPRGRAEAKKLRTQATYGKEAPEFLANELPILSQALQYGSGGMFNKGQAPSTINDLLSLLRVRPGTP